jgi:hypothetical protein
MRGYGKRVLTHGFLTLKAPLTKQECIPLGKIIYLRREKKMMNSIESKFYFSTPYFMESFRRKEDALHKLFNWISSDFYSLLYCAG